MFVNAAVQSAVSGEPVPIPASSPPAYSASGTPVKGSGRVGTVLVMGAAAVFLAVALR